MRKLNLFIIALVAMFIPTILVHAGEVQCTEDHEAKIGSKCYATFSDAVAAVQSNETIVSFKQAYDYWF